MSRRKWGNGFARVGKGSEDTEPHQAAITNDAVDLLTLGEIAFDDLLGKSRCVLRVLGAEHFNAGVFTDNGFHACQHGIRIA